MLIGQQAAREGARVRTRSILVAEYFILASHNKTGSTIVRIERGPKCSSGKTEKRFLRLRNGPLSEKARVGVGVGVSVGSLETSSNTYTFLGSVAQCDMFHNASLNSAAVKGGRASQYTADE